MGKRLRQWVVFVCTNVCVCVYVSCVWGGEEAPADRTTEDTGRTDVLAFQDPTIPTDFIFFN